MPPAKLPIVPVTLTGRQKSNMSAKARARAMYAKITPASQKAFKSFYDDLLDSPLYSGIFGLKKSLLPMVTEMKYMKFYRGYIIKNNT